MCINLIVVSSTKRLIPTKKQQIKIKQLYFFTRILFYTFELNLIQFIYHQYFIFMIAIKRLITPFTRLLLPNSRQLTITVAHNFAFMSLFEKNKSKQELSPVFKKPERIKGHIRSKNRKGYISPKLNRTTRIPEKQTLKNHRGLLKRIKLVGPRWNRQFKRLHAERYHLRRKKTTANLKRKRRAAYIHKSDLWRVKKMIPYFKRKSLKMQY